MQNPRFFSPALLNIGWRYLARHAWQSVLMVLGITLGVAVVIAIDLANASASRAFELSTESITGRATHHIGEGQDGLDEALFTRLRMSSTAPAAPVISEYVSSEQLGSRPFQLLGVDPFSEAPFRSYLGTATASASVDQLTAFLTQPGALMISKDVADRYGLKLGDAITLAVGGRDQPAFIAGLLEPADNLARRTLDGLILADISTAQEITGRIGKLDRIDLILPKDSAVSEEAIRTLLPAGVTLGPSAARSGSLEQLTAAFRVNLTALSLLALVVGLFLIYNTMTFSVVQRRGLFGTLRCLGVTRGEVFALVLSEALVVGIFGSALGIGLGLLMGQTTVGMILQTVNDLYFTTTVSQVGIPASSLIKGSLVGVLATLLTAAPPAWEAASIPPRAALLRSGLERKARLSVRWATLGGLLMIGLGMGLFLLPFRDLTSGFAGTLATVVGFALFSSITLITISKAATPVTGKLFGLLGRMAPRSLVGSLSRTSVAVAALMIAVAVTIGVSLMINAFRYTVQLWLEQTLQADIYISAPSFTGTTPQSPVDPQVLERLAGWPGVQRVDLIRSVMADSPDGPVQVQATNNDQIGLQRRFMWLEGAPDAVWQKLQSGGVVISEPLANRLGLARRGSVLRLSAGGQEQDFPVVGVYYDYASNQGIATISMDVYQRSFHNREATAAGLQLAPGVDVDATVRSLEDTLSGTQKLLIRPNRVLRNDVMVVFERTFAITSALQVLATIVAFIGVLSALLLLQLERTREIGILRAIGLTARQLWGLVMLETGLMGLVSGLLAVPTGYALSLILIYVINRRSFGWTLQSAVGLEPFAQALGVAVVAALLAGIYPAYRLGRMAAAEAIRYE